jgi:hypothetical protein
MALPPFDETGELPPGIHQASLREVLDRLGTGGPQRRGVATRLERVFHVAVATGHVARFIVFGSFVTEKREPNDVDVFLLMEDTFDVSRLRGGLHVLFDHAAAQAHFGASVFWLRRLAALDSEDSTIGYWQVKRDGGRRGIVDIRLEKA